MIFFLLLCEYPLSIRVPPRQSKVSQYTLAENPFKGTSIVVTFMLARSQNIFRISYSYGQGRGLLGSCLAWSVMFHSCPDIAISMVLDSLKSVCFEIYICGRREWISKLWYRSI